MSRLWLAKEGLCRVAKIGLSALACLACSGPTASGQYERPYLSPLLAQPAEPLMTGVGGAKVGRSSGGESDRVDPARADRPTSSDLPGIASTPAIAGMPAEAGPTVPRAEMVESARRLLGIERSFEDRSFLGHILRINAILPRGARSTTYAPQSHLEWARQERRVVANDRAQPGDIVMFECPSGCGVAEGNVAAGLVEVAKGQALTLIAYVHDKVQRCVAGGAELDGAVRLEHVLAVVSCCGEATPLVQPVPLPSPQPEPQPQPAQPVQSSQPQPMTPSTPASETAPPTPAPKSE